MKTFLDGFKRLSDELEMTERRLCIEIDLDQARLTSARRRLKQGLAVKGLQIEVLMSILEQFPGANLNAFFDANLKFFTKQQNSTITNLQKELAAANKQIALLEELLLMYRKKHD